MDRSPPPGPRDSRATIPTPSTYPSAALQTPTGAPPTQRTYPDPFQSHEDPFLPRALDRREGNSPTAGGRAGSQAFHNMPNGHADHTRPPAPLSNGTAHMPLPHDPPRRRSPGASGSPPQPPPAPLDSLSHPSPFQARHMPPPSPTQPPANSSSLPGSAPLGPPTVSPFSGIRDLASYSSSRPSGGMSISSMLGGSSEEKRTHGSPPGSTPRSMPPPSPGRARSVSMREGLTRATGEGTSARTIITEQPRPSSAVFGHDRTASEPRREALFASPQFRSESLNNFRAFQPPEHDARSDLNGQELSRRPGSQPAGLPASRSDRDPMPRESVRDARYGGFRPFGEAPLLQSHDGASARREAEAYPNGHAPSSVQAEQGSYNGPRGQQEHPPAGLLRFQAGTFGTPIREEQSGPFRPVYQPSLETTRDSIESRPFPDIRRDLARSPPPASELPPLDRSRNAFTDRPLSFDERQRTEPAPREQVRKDSDGYIHRAVFNISPEIDRKGRNSPLPQAVQGAQPRHVGPGGDNPNVKMEFGRMFSGLGSGVGTSTPTAGHANGTTTPSRMTPVRQVEGGDLVRTAVAEIEGRRSARAEGRGGKKNGRRARDEADRANGGETPDAERGSKRSKTAHHHHVHPHHHHHHHHQTMDTNAANAFNPIRFQPNQPSQPVPPANATAHHHHHHHAAPHAHPVHHHHHVPRPAPSTVPPPRRPTTTITSQKLLEDCSKKPRKHLGSQLYKLNFSIPREVPIQPDSRVKIIGRSEPIPLFQGKENCTYTVRVPRQYVSISTNPDEASYLESICKERQVWGTEVYTDDSDVVAAAVHSGWLRGDFGEFNDDLREVCENDSEQEDATEKIPTTLAALPRRPVRVPNDHDAHITLLILPPLEFYASTNQHHIWSRQWNSRHDGMSFLIQRIDFVDEAPENRSRERGAKARKARIAAEEAARRQDAAAGLLMFSRAKGAAVAAK